jgi:hypothetical protein
MAAHYTLLAIEGLDPDLNLIQGIVGIAGTIVLLAIFVKSARRK